MKFSKRLDLFGDEIFAALNEKRLELEKQGKKIYNMSVGDLNKRRGRVLGMNPDHNGNTIIEADVPLLEIYGYSTDLRSMTGGSGDFSYEFARYEQAPGDIQQKEIEARASKVAADAE